MNDTYQKLATDTRTYVRLRGELARATAVEKTARIIALILTLFCAVLILVIALGYWSAMAVIALQHAWGSLFYALLTAGSFFTVTAVVLYLLRRQLFLNPLVRALSKILTFDEPDKDETL